MKTPALLLVLACLLSGQPLLPAAAAQDTGSGVDVVFMVDASREAARRDRGDSRFTVLQAIIDMTRDRGPQAIAVLPMGGEDDAAAGRLAGLPLTPLSGDMSQDWRVLAQSVRPAVEQVGSDAASLDLPFAFTQLPELLKGRDTSRPLWVVLLTDGDADPIVGNGFPDRYAKRAGELADAEGFDAENPERQHIKDATKEALIDQAPGVLAGLGEQVVLTIINVDKDRQRSRIEHSDVAVLDALSKRTGSLPPIDLDGTNIAEAAIAALEQAPFGPRGAGGAIVRDLGPLGPSQRFHIYQGTRSARVLITATRADFDASLRYVDGGATVDFVTAGADSPVRALDMLASPPRPGDMELLLSPRGSGDLKSLGAQGRFEFDLDLRPVVTAPAVETLHALGSPFALGVKLADFEGKPLADPELLRNGKLVASWTVPGGKAPSQTWGTSGPSHQFEYTPDQPTDGARSFGWRVQSSLLPGEGGGFDWTWSDAGNWKTEVWLPSASFAFASADEHVDFTVAGAGGSLAFGTDYVSGGVTLRADLDLSVDLRGASQVPVRLTFQPSVAFASALDSGAASLAVTLDGKDVGDSSQFTYGTSTPGRVSVRVGKTGFAPFHDAVGTLLAEVVSGEPGGNATAQVELSMAPFFGTMSIVSLVVLVVLLAALLLYLRAAKRKRAWADLLAGLSDEAIIYFDDDELAAGSTS